ncbi:MAG: hypothetical protein ACK4KV_16445 [Rhodocyclaceae bacterium]
MFQQVQTIRVRAHSALRAVRLSFARPFARLNHRLRGAAVGDACLPPLRELGAQSGGTAGGRVYRMDIVCASRAVAERMLDQAWTELATTGIEVCRASLNARERSGPATLVLRLRCERAQRGDLVRFVELAGASPGVRRVRWETVPNPA